ncbi:tripartite tricarboxylate transporter substrate binding protein [Polaromonas hydrogenivorans]|uniref:Tripartite tricarboxylate transporter substrate binding protein n=1 Tax=Polaromonas hydrogenivorans TaxID=335476 RepID=A0AAU7LNL7_9BURK
MKRISFLLLLAASVSLSWPGRATAQASTYPERPVRVLQGFPAGGNADMVARIVGVELARTLGQPFVVDARPGAGGTIAADAVAKAKADGLTLLVATGAHAIAPAMYGSLPYATEAAFQPVSAITRFPFLLVVNSASKYNSLQDLLNAARAKAGTVNFGSAGQGTGQHMAGELLARSAGVSVTHVPYRGEAPAITALLGSELDFVMVAPTAVSAHIKVGKLRALATTGSTRWSGMPNLPTVAEQGLPNFELHSWTALLAPVGTPKAVIERLNAEVRAALRNDSVKARLEETTGGEARASSPDELKLVISADIKRWTQLVADAKVLKQ